MKQPTVAILGGGQLGRMLALAGYPLGLRFRFLEPAADAPMADMARHTTAAYDDLDGLRAVADGADVVTYEFENVSVDAARALEQQVPVFPPPAALKAAQDRLAEKRFFAGLGAQVPPFAPVDSREELEAAVAEIGLPAVLKTRRMGYDGKGQQVLRSVDDLAAAWDALGDQPLILEGFVVFQRELSILAVRSTGGETAFYPLVHNTHHDGILRRSVAPATGVSNTLQRDAEALAQRALDALHYVGVLAIELFEVETANGPALLVNEMAPRVHNSGHWTIEGAETSQFENHLRAVLGLPLGTTAMRGYAAMLNIIGTLPDERAALAVPGAHLHLYGKAPRPGRKLGHITVRADSAEALAERVAQVEHLL